MSKQIKKSELDAIAEIIAMLPEGSKSERGEIGDVRASLNKSLTLFII